jgi:hypothetical protein
VALQVLALAVLVTAVSSLWRNNVLLALFMLLEGGIALAFWHDARDISFLLVIGGMGSVAEAVFVGSGAWHYAKRSFFGVPLWFPIAFGTAWLIGRRLSRKMAGLWEEVIRRKAQPVNPDPTAESQLDKCRRTRLEGAASAPRATVLETVAPQR